MTEPVTLIVVALIGALAGIGGAGLGAWLAARATRENTMALQAESRADREEARRARFADRILELSGEITGLTLDWVVQVGVQLEFRSVQGAARPPAVTTDAARLVLASRELKLLIREPRSTEALDELAEASLDLTNHVLYTTATGPYHVAVVERAEREAFAKARARCHSAIEVFTDAVRGELGVSV